MYLNSSVNCQRLFSFLMPRRFVVWDVFELDFRQALTTTMRHITSLGADEQMAWEVARGAGVAVHLSADDGNLNIFELLERKFQPVV